MQRSNPRHSPRQSPRAAPNASRGGSTLPRADLLFYAKAPGMVDSIGLSSINLSFLAFDYYVDASRPDNTGNGTSAAAAWKTLDQIAANVTFAGAGTKRVYVAAGSYDTAADYINAPTTYPAGAVLEIVFAPGCVMDGSNIDVGTPKTGIATQTAANVWTLKVFGNGLIVRNYYPYDGCTTGGKAIAYFYDVFPINGEDGFSIHGESTIYTIRCGAFDCFKAPIANIGTGAFHAFNSVFVERTATGTQGLGGSFATTLTQTFTDCVFIPGKANSPLDLTNSTVTRCRIGTDAVAVEIKTNNSGPAATIESSYLNVFVEGSRQVAITNCFGKLSTRMLPTGNITIDGCVITGPATGKTEFIYSNYDSVTSSKFIIKNNIFKGNWTFDSMGGRAAYLFTALSEFKNNIMHGGVTYSAAILTAGGTSISGTVTSDPLLGAATGLKMSDYAFGPGSPAIGAGLAGGNIGFGATDVADLQHDSTLKASPEVISGTSPADWVIKFPLSSKLLIPLGIGDYFSAAGVPQSITWATHTDNTQVRFGSKSGVVYGWPQTTATIAKIDRAIGN